jgi:hypothetical protein
LSGRALLVIAAAIAVALVGAYAALGGGRFEPPKVADPCELRPSLPELTLDALGQELALTLLARGACELGVSREELALALVSENARERLLERHDLDEGLVADLLRAVDRALG